MLKVWHVRLNTRLFHFAKDQGTKFGKHTTKISPRKDDKTKFLKTQGSMPLNPSRKQGP